MHGDMIAQDYDLLTFPMDRPKRSSYDCLTDIDSWLNCLSERFLERRPIFVQRPPRVHLVQRDARPLQRLRRHSRRPSRRRPRPEAAPDEASRPRRPAVRRLRRRRGRRNRPNGPGGPRRRQRPEELDVSQQDGLGRPGLRGGLRVGRADRRRLGSRQLQPAGRPRSLRFKGVEMIPVQENVANEKQKERLILQEVLKITVLI